MKNNELTSAQLRVYQLLGDFYNRYKIYPTLTQITKILNYKAVSSTQRQMEILVKKGWLIHRSKGKYDFCKAQG